MGPRPDDRGNGGNRRDTKRFIGSLQWGRDLMIAETLLGVVGIVDDSWLQWGRDLMIAETSGLTLEEIVNRPLLQWGRDLMIAETMRTLRGVS